MMRWGILWAAMVTAAVIVFSTPGMAEARAVRGFASGAAEPTLSSSVPIGGSKTFESTPSFSVDPSAEQGRPGDRITLSFATNDPVWAIVDCRAGFGDSQLPCSGSPGSDWSVELAVPENAASGPTSIPWRLFYRAADNVVGTHDAPPPYQDGTTPFVVLSPAAASPSATVPGGSAGDGSGGAESALPSSPAPAGSLPSAPRAVSASNDHSFPIGVPLLLVVLASAALAATLFGRRRRAAPGAGVFAGAPPVPGAARSVRAVPRPDTAIQVTVGEGPAGHTHVVRIEPHRHIGTVEVREVRR